LTNSGVPVSLTDSDADEIFPSDLTVQPPHRYAEPLNLAGILMTEGESDELLFRLTIIRFTKLNSTSIGGCNSQVLCEPFIYPPISKTAINLFFPLPNTRDSPFNDLYKLGDIAYKSQEISEKVT